MNPTLPTRPEAVPILLLALASTLLILASRRARRPEVGPFRGAFDVACVGLAIVQPDGRWSRVNPRLLTLLGYIERELAAIDKPSLVHPDDRDRFGQLVAGREAGGPEVVRLVHRRGEVFRARVWASPLVDRGGKMSSLVVQVEELCEPAPAQPATREADGPDPTPGGLLKGTIEGLDHSIATLDADHRYAACNESYRRDFARSFSRPVGPGTSLIEALDAQPDERRSAVAPWERTLLGEAFAVAWEDEVGNFEFAFRPIRDGEGRRIGSSHVIRNLGERPPGDPGPPDPPAEPTPAPPPAPPAPASTALAGPRVLVADGEASGRDALIGLLEELGCSAEAAVDGPSAVEAWERGTFDLILMATGLPGLDGPGSALAVRRREAKLGRERTPILALTASPGGEEAGHCLDSGMDGELAGLPTRPGLQAALDRLSSPDRAPRGEEPPLRFSGLLERCLGDVQFAREVLDSFRETAPVSLGEIVTLAGRGDLRRLALETHGLKGSSATIGAFPLSAACAALEASARAGDLHGIEVALGRSKAAWSSLAVALAAEVGEEPS